MSLQPITKYQKFEAVTINRAEIKNALYNPRTIDQSARKKLKDKIKSKVGLIETLVWNKRTGNLVSGHQRISILDELEGKKDYSLSVAVIDVDGKTEKEINVFMNNSAAQGNYDTGLLEVLFKDSSVDFENMGFDKLDIDMMFDGRVTLPGMENLFDDKKEKAKTDIEKINKMKECRKKYKERVTEENDSEFYTVIVFQTRKESEGFLKKIGLPIDARYVDGHKFADLVGVRFDKS